jgi:hypothetical protein
VAEVGGGALLCEVEVVFDGAPIRERLSIPRLSLYVSMTWTPRWVRSDPEKRAKEKRRETP